jgi:ectoine hydroxylase
MVMTAGAENNGEEDVMELNEEQIWTYHNDGMLVLPKLFNAEEVAALRAALSRDREIGGDHVIVEGGEVRAVYASHRRQAEFAALVASPRVLRPVQMLLCEDVYVYQFKTNTKAAFGGDKWSWHQDYAAWRIVDRLPTPRVISVGLYLDDVTEFNGPLIFAPGSHRDGLIRDGRSDVARSEQHLDPDDIALSTEQVATVIKQYGMCSPKGSAGTVVLFSAEVVHGSSTNMSPFPRSLTIVSYSDVQNVPRGELRPDYLVGHDTAPLQLGPDHNVTASDGARS